MEKYASQLSGKGASINGARWNSPSIELIYTSANRSLAMAEVAVHITWETVFPDFAMSTIFIPDDISLQKFVPADLPSNWNVFPYLLTTQAVGDRFVSMCRHCVLQIPSVVTMGDSNFLINPNHPEIKRIKIISVDKFPFDQRMFR